MNDSSLVLQASGLTKRFSEGLLDVEVLKGIDLEVNEGDVVVIIGPSGSGKSTFLRCLNLLETPTSGYVAVADLTFAGNRIRGVTYSPFMPLIAVALIYLAVVMFFTWLVGKLERRLRQGDNR